MTVEEMADRPGRLAAVRARLDALGVPRGEVDARSQAFTLATLAERPFSDPAWLFEIKYDGVRVLAERRGERVTLYGRSGQDTTSRYPEVVRALRALAIERFVIDGEIVALDAAGRPSFQRLQPRMALTDPHEIAMAAQQRPAVGVFFDCLTLATIAICAAGPSSSARSACGSWCPRWGRCATATTWSGRATRSSRPRPRSASRASWPRRRAGRTRVGEPATGSRSSARSGRSS